MEIRIYVEGGGDQRAGKDALQRGISQFLNPIREMARKKRISFRVIACGSRNSAFGDFDYALRSHPEAINILLIDAEGLVHHQIHGNTFDSVIHLGISPIYRIHSVS
jgi:hypothetical protein